MNRRERLLTTIARKQPDRVPIGYDAWVLTRQKIYEHYGVNSNYELYQKTGIDGFSLWDWPVAEPKYIGEPRPHIEQHTITCGIWGSNPEVFHPLEKDYDTYRWPTTSDMDFSNLKAQLCDAHEKDMVSIGAHISVGLNHHIRLRGYMDALYDVMDDEFMEDYMGHVREYFIAYLNTLFKAADGKMDIIRCDEDAGGNETLMINPVTWRKWYKPLWKELFDICHANHCYVWLHSCGYCRSIVDDFIEMGADILDPIPPYVKDSDPFDMKQTYGDKLCLHGGVNHIDAMVYGTPHLVDEEVKLRMEQMKGTGGYICGPSQFLTDQIPLENIVAFFDAALKYGEY